MHLASDLLATIVTNLLPLAGTPISSRGGGSAWRAIGPQGSGSGGTQNGIGHINSFEGGGGALRGGSGSSGSSGRSNSSNAITQGGGSGGGEGS